MIGMNWENGTKTIAERGFVFYASSIGFIDSSQGINPRSAANNKSSGDEQFGRCIRREKLHEYDESAIFRALYQGTRRGS
jgi:hypothetical protein